MNSDARPYEISFLVRSEEDVQAVAALLSEHGVKVTDEGQVRRLNLAYPIRHVTEGYFGYLKALLDPATAKALENAVLTNKAVLRMLILADEPEKARPEKARKPAPAAERAAAPAPALSNADLEKELERLTTRS